MELMRACDWETEYIDMKSWVINYSLTHRQTHGQTDTRTDRHTDRQTPRRTDTRTDIHPDRHTDRPKDTQIYTYIFTILFIMFLNLATSAKWHRVINYQYLEADCPGGDNSYLSFICCGMSPGAGDLKDWQAYSRSPEAPTMFIICQRSNVGPFLCSSRLPLHHYIWSFWSLVTEDISRVMGKASQPVSQY